MYISENDQEALLSAARANDVAALQKWSDDVLAYEGSIQRRWCKSNNVTMLDMQVSAALTSDGNLPEFLKVAAPLINEGKLIHVMRILLMRCEGDDLELLLNALDERMQVGEFDHQIALRMVEERLKGKDMHLVVARAKAALEAGDGRVWRWLEQPRKASDNTHLTMTDGLWLLAYHSSGEDLRMILDAANTVISDDFFRRIVLKNKLSPENANWAVDVVAMAECIDRNPTIIAERLAVNIVYFRERELQLESGKEAISIPQWRNDVRDSEALMGVLRGNISPSTQCEAALWILGEMVKKDREFVQKNAPEVEEKVEKEGVRERGLE